MVRPSEVIWFNGELVPWDQAQVHVLTHCLHYGSGVFEGIRAYPTPKGPAVLALDEHVRRLFRSCKVISMPLPVDEEGLSEAILETIRRNGHESCYIRPFAFRGSGPMGLFPLKSSVELAVATWEWDSMHGDSALQEGIDVCVSSWRRMAPDTHPAMAKVSGNYVNSQLAMVEAVENGFHEALLLDSQGYLSEGSGENIFVRLDGRVLTPPLGDSILPGITRRMVMQLLVDQGEPVQEQRIAREMLHFADEVFLTGTAAEITPVRSVDRKPVGAGKPGELTRALQDDFFGIVKGEAEDRHGWLTYVNA